MRYFIFLILVFSYLDFIHPQAKGSLLVDGEPGFRVYVDDQLMGITNKEDGGLFLKSLPIGKINLKISKSGFEDKFFRCEISTNKTTEIKLTDLRRIVDENKIIKIKGFYFSQYGIEKNLIAANKYVWHVFRFFPGNKKVAFFPASGRENDIMTYSETNFRYLYDYAPNSDYKVSPKENGGLSLEIDPITFYYEANKYMFLTISDAEFDEFGNLSMTIHYSFYVNGKRTSETMRHKFQFLEVY
jgi:hypothetical protein